MASGSVAVLDPNSLTVTTVRQVLPPANAAATAATSRNGDMLFVAAGSTLHTLDVNTLTLSHTWTLGSATRGMVASPRSGLLWVGLDESVVAVDPATGRVTATVSVPGLRGLRHVSG